MHEMTLEVTDLKQWHICPRVVWYRFCLPDIRPVTALMEQGKASHRDESTREERRSLRAYELAAGERFFDVPLRSARLGLVGRLDLAIAVPDRTTPGAYLVVVEYKDTEEEPGSHIKLQLVTYALLLEEMWGLPVSHGFIYRIPLRDATRVAFTPALRNKALQTITTIQQAIQGEMMPPAPKNRRLCVQCEFRRFCNDVV
ncbi:MAG: CRISPR-associated protein Cas4 [Chloroflexaceae bacterium]|nr:CRISPR-associated protein Cas4 [Chloroflexaceae bacterium]